MKGFVPTPSAVVDLMVDKLFRERPPRATDTVLDPGCGEGAFMAGVLRRCAANGHDAPRIVGIDSDPAHVRSAAELLRGDLNASVHHRDFLATSDARFDFIIGNPPYVPITALSVAERDDYRARYATARGRFDLYLLFFEQALKLLKPNGRLVFITPEKFLYVETARPLREMLRTRHVAELHLVDEATFGDLVTYPLITTINGGATADHTEVIHRNGRSAKIHLDKNAPSWLPQLLDAQAEPAGLRLADICVRISCGVATGADSAFVVHDDARSPWMHQFSRPTIAGRQMVEGLSLAPSHSLLLPYDDDGALLAEESLGEFGAYLREDARYRQLTARTCAERKPWYAYHETPPLGEMLAPKLLCKDITASPFFMIDRTGEVVPRHSVYYVVPTHSDSLDELAAYLNSAPAREWLTSHCQRAANGYLRLQSHVLKQLPLPAQFERYRNASDAEPFELALEVV